eukprot:scaffold4450_cov113-Isochrysis_galbana.AAC.9
MVRNRLARIPLIAAALGTRLSQTFAPASRAAVGTSRRPPSGHPASAPPPRVVGQSPSLPSLSLSPLSL